MEGALNTESDLVGDLEAGKIGIWIFLVSEILLFGGFFSAYVMLRLGSPVCGLGAPAWPAAGYTGGLALATLNTVLLITSSFTMVRAYGASLRKEASGFSRNLLATVLLGAAFLGIKSVEYALKIQHGYLPKGEFAAANPGLGIFLSFYFAMTGLHAVHVIIGMAWNAALLLAGKRGGLRDPAFARKMEYAGLYWHFVDIIWVFLFPLFYLI